MGLLKNKKKNESSSKIDYLQDQHDQHDKNVEEKDQKEEEEEEEEELELPDSYACDSCTLILSKSISISTLLIII